MSSLQVIAIIHLLMKELYKFHGVPEATTIPDGI